MDILCRFNLIVFFTLCFLDTAVAAVKIKSQTQIKISYSNFAEVKNTNDPNQVDLDLKHKSVFYLSENTKANLSVGAYGASYPDYAFSLPEVDLVFSINRESLIRVGRSKLRHSSYLDSDWLLGVQTAFLRINPLYPEEQGRMGISYRFESDQVFGEFYGSPLSVPDQFPGFKVSAAGRVTSENPWSRLPPERVLLSTGAELDLSYDVVDDSLPDLIADHQFGGALGVKTDYLKIIGMYSNRPSKQTGFLLDAKIQTGPSSPVSVETKPVFLREHFFGAQAEAQWFKNFFVKNGFYGLILEDNDNDASFQTKSSDYFFITTDFNLKLGKYIFSLQHLYVKERENIKEGVTYIDASRFLYGNTVALKANNLIFGKFRSSLAIFYSYKEEIARFTLESSYKKNKHWSYWARLNLMESFEDKEDVDQGLLISSGLSSFVALDNINLGVSYVF